MSQNDKETKKRNWNKIIVNEIVCFSANNNYYYYYFVGRAKKGRCTLYIEEIQNKKKTQKSAQHHNQLNYKMRHITYQLKIEFIFMFSFHSNFAIYFFIIFILLLLMLVFFRLSLQK